MDHYGPSHRILSRHKLLRFRTFGARGFIHLPSSLLSEKGRFSGARLGSICSFYRLCFNESREGWRVAALWHFANGVFYSELTGCILAQLVASFITKNSGTTDLTNSWQRHWPIGTPFRPMVCNPESLRIGEVEFLIWTPHHCLLQCSKNVQPFQVKKRASPSGMVRWCELFLLFSFTVSMA